MFQFKLPNGQYMIPNDDGHVPTLIIPGNAYVPGTAVFSAHQLVSNLDWNRSASDILSLKYYFQDDPTVAPYAYSMVAGFTQHLAAGSQVISLSNIQTPAAQFQRHRNLWVRAGEYLQFRRPAFYAATVGYQHLRLYPFSRDEHCRYFRELLSLQRQCCAARDASLNIGQGSASQGAFTGVTQNRFMPSAQRHVEPGQAHGDFRRKLFLYPTRGAR